VPERQRFERELADLDLREYDVPPPGQAAIATKQPSSIDQLMNLIPRKGLINDIYTVSQLADLFDETQAKLLATRVRASLAAKKLAKQYGIWALVALHDTSGSTGLDVKAAEAALQPRNKKHLLDRATLDAVMNAGKQLPGEWERAWFTDLRVARMRVLGLRGDPPPSMEPLVDSRTSSVTGMKLEILFAADTSRDLSNSKRDVLLALNQLSRNVATLSAKADRQKMQECMSGFTTGAPLRILIAAVRPDDIGLDPVTAMVYLSDADVGNPTLRKPVIRLPEAFIISATQSGLPRPIVHELVHFHLMRHAVGSNAIWDQTRAGLTLAGPTRLQRLASWLVFFHLAAQEEIFTFGHVARAFSPLPKVESEYRKYVAKSREVLKTLGASLTTQKTTISTPATRATWQIEWEFPRALSPLRYVDGPMLRETLAMFPTAKT
jgi:hypothetical protein